MKYFEPGPWHRPKLKSVMIMVLIAATLFGCAARWPRQDGKKASVHEAVVDIRYNGVQRTYLVHRPPGYDAGQPLPLVVVLHGAFGNARGVEKLSGFSELADEKRFIVLYPNGNGVMGGFQHWNAGHCCGTAAANGIDDAGFIETVIKDTCRRLAVDQNRIFMVGFSNGGMMTYRFAAEKGDMLAAVAVLAASAGSQGARWTIPEPVKALPVIAFHGLADKHVPFQGGASPGRKSANHYWPAMRSLGIWEARNGCAQSPEEHDQRHGKVHVRTWKECTQHRSVVLYTLEGWTHLWPTRYYTDKLDSRDPLYRFDATSVIWDFFDASTR